MAVFFDPNLQTTFDQKKRAAALVYQAKSGFRCFEGFLPSDPCFASMSWQNFPDSVRREYHFFGDLACSCRLTG